MPRSPISDCHYSPSKPALDEYKEAVSEVEGKPLIETATKSTCWLGSSALPNQAVNFGQLAQYERHGNTGAMLTPQFLQGWEPGSQMKNEESSTMRQLRIHYRYLLYEYYIVYMSAI